MTQEHIQLRGIAVLRQFPKEVDWIRPESLGWCRWGSWQGTHRSLQSHK